jgi:tryptophan synthase beta subunit
MQTNLRSQAGPYFGEFGGRFVAEPLIAASGVTQELHR